MNFTRRISSACLLAASSLALGACASMSRPASPEQPRANEPRFAVLNASDERRTAALANWKTVLGEQVAAAAPTPELRPVTATLAALPSGLRDYPRLPLVVVDKDEKSQSEEETRESLRRFLGTAAPLLGFDLKHLSLVEVSDAPTAGGGARRALYLQTPFAYPLRNGYGVIEVTFTPDLRVVGLSSTAVPYAEPLARSLVALAKPLTAEQAAASLLSRPVTYTDSGGAQQTRTLTQADVGTAQLVVFPVPRDAADPTTLELHVAWEVRIGGGKEDTAAYVDAATGELLGVKAWRLIINTSM
jgi:hypothetical protein